MEANNNEIKEVLYDKEDRIPFAILTEFEVVHKHFPIKHKMIFSHTTYDEKNRPTFFYKLGECSKIDNP